ncbi:hypothetical protein N0V85_002068 [Neurospora sp. IMI 360204]|nr:hypothetical protein N0V85_002068 [Neurospora sp. IMI 360204]
MAASFHHFPHLPWELRSRIWEQTVEPRTVEPRTVEVSITYYKKPVTDEMMAKYNLEPSNFPWISVRRLRSSTPVPAPLHACREARNHLTKEKDGLGYHYYQKALQYLLAATWQGRFMKLQPDFRLELGLDPGPRYIWINFERDMISIGRTPFDKFVSFYKDIKRLKFEREHDDDFIDYNGFCRWDNLQEVHIVCADGLDNWALVEDDFRRCSAKNNILLIDGKTGETARPSDFADKWDLDELRAVQYRKDGARINPDTDVPFVPWLRPGWLEGEQYFGETYYENGEADWERWEPEDGDDDDTDQ